MQYYGTRGNRQRSKQSETCFKQMRRERVYFDQTQEQKFKNKSGVSRHARQGVRQPPWLKLIALFKRTRLLSNFEILQFSSRATAPDQVLRRTKDQVSLSEITQFFAV